MWIPLPEGLASFLQMVGFEWPVADEEKLWDCGDAWGTFAADLRDLTTQADRAVRRVLDDNSDDSIQAFGERWEHFTKEPATSGMRPTPPSWLKTRSTRVRSSSSA